MNEPRLIDANELVKYMQTQKPIITLDDIARFPTAYDIDKVVERLESLETYKQTVTMEKHPFCASEIETVSKKKAIEIAKGNYSENPNSSKGGAVDETKS